MRLLIITFLIAGYFNPSCSRYKPVDYPSGKADETFTYSGNILFTQNYCGGVAPSEEMMMEIRKPKPFSGFTMYIENVMTQTVVDSFTTDESGNFEIHLPAGKYCLKNAEKFKVVDPGTFNPEYITFDIECHKKWVHTCDKEFEIVDSNITGITMTFHKRCFLNTFNPCQQYVGPLPP